VKSVRITVTFTVEPQADGDDVEVGAYLDASLRHMCEVSDDAGRIHGYEMRSDAPKPWLVVIEGDAVPSVFGPFGDDTERLGDAAQHREDNGDKDGLYRLDVGADGVPVVDSFGNGELDAVIEQRAKG